MTQILSVLQAPWRPNQNFKIHFFFYQRCYFSVKDFFCKLTSFLNYYHYIIIVIFLVSFS